MQLGGRDYTLIQMYEENESNMVAIKNQIKDIEQKIKDTEKKMSSYDYDMPQVPDPKYDMLCKLPTFFNELHKRLLKAKKKVSKIR